MFDRKMKMKKILKLAPLFILLVSSVIVIINAITTDAAFTRFHIAGLAGVGIATVAQFFDKKIGSLLTCIILILGTCSVIRFTTDYYYLFIGSVKFDAFSIVIFFLFMIFHWDDFKEWLNS